MKRVKLLTILLPALLVFARPPAVAADTVELKPTADSFVNDGYPENNYGSAHSLVTSFDSVHRWALVRFDLSSIPSEAEIDSAIFKAYLYDPGGDTSVPLMCAVITGNWSETSVKWNNRPMFNESSGVILNVDSTVAYKSWDVTNFVRGWQNNDYNNYGLALNNAAGNWHRSFRSREYTNTDQHPILTVDYHIPEEPEPTETTAPTSTPEPDVSPTPATEEPTFAPTEAVSPTPETTPEATKEASLVFSLTPGQAIIGGLILLTLIGALVAFALYFRKEKEKPESKPKTKKKEAKKSESADEHLE